LIAILLSSKSNGETMENRQANTDNTDNTDKNNFTVNHSMSSPAFQVASMFSVEGKTVVITGGSNGIGLMIASAFFANRANVILVSRDQKKLEKAASRLTSSTAQANHSCHFIVANIANSEECVHVAKKIANLFPAGFDILINNAGTNWAAPLESYPDSAWDKVLALNVKAVFNMTQVLLPLLEKKATSSNPSRIINIGSVDGLRVPRMETYAYSTSKAAVHHLSRVLAAKLSEKNITVNSIAAGPFPSKMMEFTLKTAYDTVVSSVPMKRIGSPIDISGAVLYLSSAAGSWITGITLTVDGGIVLQASI